MAYLSDIEIAQSAKMLPVTEIAKSIGIEDDYIESYGKYKAKINYTLLNESKRENGKLVLVTAITPTPAGEGKTTTTIGLADGMKRIGKNVAVALREPSLGPFSELRAARQAAATLRLFPWRTLTCTLREISTPSARQTIFSPL